MISFSTIEEAACLRGSDEAVQKVKDILAFIDEKRGTWEIVQGAFGSLYLEGKSLRFSLSVKIPY